MLESIEARLRDHEWSSISDLAHFSALSIREAEYQVCTLQMAGQIYRENLQYQRYQMDFSSLNLLVLADFAKNPSYRGLP